MITQLEALNVLEEEGFDATKRTLGYWRERGFLPPLERDGQQYYWKENVLDKLRDLCTKRLREKEILVTVNLLGLNKEVERVEFKRINGIAKRIIYLSDGAFMVTKQREEAINAVTQIE